MELVYAYLRLLVAFPLVIALIYFGLRFLVPYFAPSLGRESRLKIVERLPLNNRAFIYVVSVDEHYFLLAATPNAVTLLKDLGEEWEKSRPETPEKVQMQRKPFPFAETLRKLSGK